jgi:hypothetical protein
MAKSKNTVRITVYLNGTDKNPFRVFGLNQNPFPQIAKHEYAGHLLHLQALGGDPIPDTDYIRRYLAGWNSTFVEVLCSQFRKGEMVKFDVEFPG